MTLKEAFSPLSRDGNQTQTRWVNPKPDTSGTGFSRVIGYGSGYGISLYFFRGFGTSLGFDDIPVYPT